LTECVWGQFSDNHATVVHRGSGNGPVTFDWGDPHAVLLELLLASALHFCAVSDSCLGAC